MPPLAWAAAILTLVAAAVTVRTSGAWPLLVATAVTAMFAPLAGEPAPPVASLVFRVAAVLVAFAGVAAVRRSRGLVDPAARMPLGGLADAAFVVVAFVIGLGAGAATALDPLAMALTVALAVAAVDLVAFGPGVMRAVAGVAIALVAADLAVRAVTSEGVMADVAGSVAIAAAVASAGVLARSAEEATAAADGSAANR